MSKTVTRVAVSALVLVGAVSLLFYMTVRGGVEYYKHVDEVTRDPTAWYGKSLQLHGFARSIEVIPSTLDYRFDIQNNGQIIHATYRGIVPDTFKDGSEVVLKGRLGPSGFVVEHDGVMAKCPSKYAVPPAGGTGQ
jgi:cytochrome c-type biogenesis protein CcmE